MITVSHPCGVSRHGQVPEDVRNPPAARARVGPAARAAGTFPSGHRAADRQNAGKSCRIGAARRGLGWAVDVILDAARAIILQPGVFSIAVNFRKGLELTRDNTPLRRSAD